MEELFKSLSESVSEGCFEDILGIVEEIISEVSAGYVKQKAQNALPSRKAKYEEASPDDTLPNYNRFPDYDKRKERYERAKLLAQDLPDTKHSINKLRNAVTDKVLDQRIQDAENAYSTNKSEAEKKKANKRESEAIALHVASPRKR